MVSFGYGTCGVCDYESNHLRNAGTWSQPIWLCPWCWDRRNDEKGLGKG